MKLKQKPEDFIVEEILPRYILDKVSRPKESNNNQDNPDQNKGYKIYLLRKKSLETFALLRYISKNNNIPLKEIGFAGLKDKHAYTSQYITIPSQYNLSTVKEKNFEIELVGYVKSPIKTGDLVGNKFTIVVRDFREKEIAKLKSILTHRRANINIYGIPNYFDSQRFGSVINREFIAKHLAKQDYEGAVNVFVTKYNKSERAKIKNEKRKIEKEWGNILEGKKIETKNKLFNLILSEYYESKIWLKAYLKIPRNLREMFVIAYQSYLWNECVKEVIKEAVMLNKESSNNLSSFGVQYNAGRMVFFEHNANATINAKDLSELALPQKFKTISPKIKMSEYEEQIINKVFMREGIILEELDIRKETGTFFSTLERDVFVKPENLTIYSQEKDEVNS